MSEQISIRELTAMADLNATVELQRAVWGMQDAEAASPHTLRAIVHSGGGAVFGAVARRHSHHVARRHSHHAARERLVGFCFGFAAPRDGELWLWSHMAAVHPDLQGRGIGFRLKQTQRAWALKQGYRWMAWTFDPMQAGNANFNFNRLGVTARRYSADHYGEMKDGLNAGLASDRLEAQWRLDAPKVLAMAASPHQPGLADAPDALTMLVVEKRGTLEYRPPPARDERWCVARRHSHFGVEIPADVADLKRNDVNRARKWQQYVRAAMTELLADGYVVSGFCRQGDAAWYILGRDG